MQCNAMQCNAMQCNAMQCNVMYVCMSACLPVCLYDCMSVCVYVFMRVCVYVCMCVASQSHSYVYIIIYTIIFMICTHRYIFSFTRTDPAIAPSLHLWGIWTPPRYRTASPWAVASPWRLWYSQLNNWRWSIYSLNIIIIRPQRNHIHCIHDDI